MFSNLFKPADKRTPQEKFDDMKKEVRANSRAVEHQIKSLQREMKKVDADIKKSAKAGATPNVLKIKCKNRVRIQNGIERLYTVKANIESTLTQMQLQKANILQAEAMKKGSIQMKAMNESMSAQDMMSITTEFQREMERYGMVSEMMDDGFSMMDGEIDELVDEETDKVLMEVAGMKMGDLVNAASAKQEQKQMEAANNVTSALPDIPV